MKKVMKNNITLFNSFSNLLLQILTIISGFIIPKLTLDNFGSEVNGLVSSLTQFLNYITLIEGGVTSVITANLYKPLVNNEKSKINSIMKTTNRFYKNISYIYIIYSIILAVFYPVLFKTSFSYIYVFSLTLILSISLLIQYMFSLSLRTLLIAGKKMYIVSIVQILILLLNLLLFYVTIKIYPNIHALKLITGLLYIIQPIVFNRVIKKYYELDKNVNEDKNLLKSRWDGFAINVAYFIHNGTDIAILTILTNLKRVSVYSVYTLVTAGIKKIIMSLSSGINPTIGNIYATGKKEELDKKFEIYEFSIFILVFFFFTVGCLLITPFVLLYTNNITDISYNEPSLGYILMLAEGIYCLREPYVGLAYSANKFKDIKWPSYIEASINIILSVVLVFHFGLIGVAIGTLVAMTYRTLFHVHYFKKKVLNRPVWIFYKKLLLFSIISIIGILICNYLISIKPINLLNWVICAIIYSVVFGILYLIISKIFYKEDLKYFQNKFKKKVK